MMRVRYVLLVLVPITLVLEFAHIGGHSPVFPSSALALVPLAAVVGSASEETAVCTGPKIGALLNATLGNAAELIITIVALREGLVDVVKASTAGSIIGKILLVLGLALLLGGLRNGTQFLDAAVLISVGGESNWLEGAELVALDLVLGIAIYFVP